MVMRYIYVCVHVVIILALLHHAIVQSVLHLEQGVCHAVALPFTLKSILRQKKNYGNSNILPDIFKKNPLKETKILRDIIISL